MLYGFSCGLLGDVLDVKAEKGDLFHMDYHHVVSPSL
jgi:hypothetical protein